MAKSQLKKVLKIFTREQHKSASASAKEKEDAELRAKNIEEAKKVFTLLSCIQLLQLTNDYM